MKVSTTSAITLAFASAVVAQTCPAVNTNLVNVAKLNDPFTFGNGAKVTTKADWACRRNEISEAFQRHEYGTKPGKPSSVTGSFSGSTLTINCSEGGKSMSFTVTISKPAGAGPFPAVIAFGSLSIPKPSNVATITFNNDNMGAQSGGGSRGTGRFYDLYGSNHSAGSMQAWAWGVSRIIDALETTPSAGINPKKIAVTGCSRNGKGAFAAGAFDERIALTIPQESGAGGSTCHRISDSLKSSGANIQTASNAAGEQPWFGSAFTPLSTRVTTLPFDHHMLAGLVAPRGLLIIDNDIDWLGPRSSHTCMAAGRTIYKSLGAEDSMGYSLTSGHTHCSFPSSQQPELTAFYNRFLLDQSANTNVFKSGAGTSVDNSWITWTAPTLSVSASRPSSIRSSFPRISPFPNVLLFA